MEICQAKKHHCDLILHASAKVGCGLFKEALPGKDGSLAVERGSSGMIGKFGQTSDVYTM